MRTLDDVEVEGRRVLLRVDINSPVDPDTGGIADDTRMRLSLPTIRELSGALGMDNSYVARLLRLTLLAPDITEAILEGTEPSGISLEKLFRLPLDWGRQRDALGVPQPE